MNCQNCGAPMQLVRDEDYFYCGYCTSYYFPERTKEGLRILGEPSDWPCPICRTQLVLASADGPRVLACPKCRGVLVAQHIFGHIVAYLRAQQSGPAVRPRRLRREQLNRQLDCPSCGQRMDTHPYYGPGNVVIDTCEHCGLVWLDGGELSRIIRAPGSDRGRPRQASLCETG